MKTFSEEVLSSVAQVALAQMSYDPDTGVICWKPGRKYAKRKNGEPLGCDDGRKGYQVIYITVNGVTRQHRAHRIAWLLHYGEWPDGEIDHINHNKKDNRIQNLRCVAGGVNQKNKGLSSKNKSGYTGVHYCVRRKAWIGQFSDKRKKVYLGRFGNPEAASKAVTAARLKAGFHENHGID